MLGFLNYPYDINVIYKIKLLERELLFRNPTRVINIAIVSGSTTSEIANFFKI